MKTGPKTRLHIRRGICVACVRVGTAFAYMYRGFVRRWFNEWKAGNEPPAGGCAGCR